MIEQAAAIISQASEFVSEKSRITTEKIDMWHDKTIQKRVFAICKASGDSTLMLFPSQFGGWRTPVEAYIAIQNGKDIGFCIYTQGKRINKLYEIAVLPEYRRLGVGRMLFNAYVNESVGKTLRWKTNSSGLGYRFYIGLGYSPIGKSPDGIELLYEESPISGILR